MFRQGQRRLLAGPAEVFLSGAHVIACVYAAEHNLMPLAVINRMLGIVADRVLASKFGRNLIQHIVYRVGIFGIRRHQDGLSAARGGHAVQYAHVRGIPATEATTPVPRAAASRHAV